MLFRLMEDGRVVMIIVVHADDIFAVRKKDRCDQFGWDFNEMVPVKNLGDLRFFSACLYEIHWDWGTLKISQPTYAIQLVEEYRSK